MKSITSRFTKYFLPFITRFVLMSVPNKRLSPDSTCNNLLWIALIANPLNLGLFTAAKISMSAITLPFLKQFKLNVTVLSFDNNYAKKTM